MTNTIHYGIGREYLSNWGLQQALREIYQNFLDYGDYEENVVQLDEHMVRVSVSNDWVPESLDFLRIGNSKKHNPDAIGKHGEGVKMAFLIFLRTGFLSSIITDKYIITPAFTNDPEIGECFSMNYVPNDKPCGRFIINFECHADDYIKFKDNVITEDDVIFTHDYGNIVNKEAGRIYSGGLFVAAFKNMSKAYDILPKYLPLDRDRCAPASFDVNYHASKINEYHGKITAEELSHSDTMYTSKIPDEVKRQIKPQMVGNSLEFVVKGKNGQEDKIITSSHIKESLKQDSFFEKTIKKIRMYVAKKLGLYDLLVQFRDKHVHSTDALADFGLILERVEKPTKEIQHV